MTYNYTEEKNFGTRLIIGFIVVVLCGYFAMTAVVDFVGKHTYSYDQYVLKDGTVFTIRWDDEVMSEYKNVSYYYGEIVKGNETQRWYTDAATWYNWMYEIDNDYYDGLTVVEYWKW